ncbi:hypothetical protein ZWY2020_040880 [Hordeum vulgare]|nr:hypothetical protein ZWY2020_040880 [Hordeum vulgare]
MAMAQMAGLAQAHPFGHGFNPHSGDKCDFLQWVDPVWTIPLIKSLSKLWEIYTKVRYGRVHDAFNNVEIRFKFTYGIEKLQLDLRNAQDEHKKMFEEN